MKKRLLAMILACIMALGTSTMILAASAGEVAPAEISTDGVIAPRAVSINLGNCVIPYNGYIDIDRTGAYVPDKWQATWPIPPSSAQFKVRSGVPVTFSFDFDESQYINVYLMTSNTSIINLYKGEVKNFSHTRTFDRDVSIWFSVWNYTAGDIAAKNLTVRY